MKHEELIARLGEAAGHDNVSRSLPDRVAYAADMWPRAQIWKLGDEPARYEPQAVVWIADRVQLGRVLRACAQARCPVIPYGGGSGVCGGALPLQGGVMLDLKRMNRLVSLRPEDRVAVVEAGAIGELVERELREKGFTHGHFPSSIYCSTVGGYVAARSAGQYSSRYGNFEDLTGDVTVALADGRLVTVGPRAQGPDWSQIFAGSEGTLGVVVDAELKLSPAPEREVFRGFHLKSVAAGVEAMRRLMQSGLRPCVLRLYDPFDTLIAASEPHQDEAPSEEGGLRARLLESIAPLRGDFEKGALQVLLARPTLLNRLAGGLPLGCLLVVGFEGSAASVERDAARAWRLLAEAGGRDRGPGPGEAWHQNRYAVSFKQSRVFQSGAFVDTMEVSTSWDRVVSLYDGVRRAVGPHAFIMAHFSHAYREGCSIYFTMVGRAGEAAEAARLHERLWQAALRAVVAGGGSISHHHGVGVAKTGFLADEYGEDGATWFAALKRGLDPGGLLNPGKLWEHEAAQARARQPASQAPTLPRTGAVDTLSGICRLEASLGLDALSASLDAQGWALPFFPLAGGRSLSLGEALSRPASLDWGPAYGDLRDNLLALDGVSPGGARLRQRPAPRRAAGPDLVALLLGGEERFGTITSALTRLVRLDEPRVRLDWQAGSAAALVAALRALLDEDLPIERATLRAEGHLRSLHILVPRGQREAARETVTRILGDAGALCPVETWPEPGAPGFRHALFAHWSAVVEALEAAPGEGLSLLASRVESHGAWLAPCVTSGGERAQKSALAALRRACPLLPPAGRSLTEKETAAIARGLE